MDFNLRIPDALAGELTAVGQRRGFSMGNLIRQGARFMLLVDQMERDPNFTLIVRDNRTGKEREITL